MHRIMMAAALVAAVVVAPAAADTVELGPSQDNTLFQDDFGSLSNGSGPHTYVGSTSFGAIRRAVVAFDVAAVVPAGSTVNSATLTLHMSSGNPLDGDRVVRLHRVTSDWGEGASNAGSPGGSGATSQPTDATWIHTFYSSFQWATAGGDYDAQTSSQLPVPWNASFLTWPSSSRMVQDVQLWLDSPAQSFGWIAIGVESVEGTARRFDSRENVVPDVRPVLTINFTPPGCIGDTNGSGTVDVTDLVNVILDWGTDGSANNGDVTGDGIVDVADIVAVITAWGACP